MKHVLCHFIWNYQLNNMNKLEETINVAQYAEKELEQIMNEVELQSEKLLNIQKKSGMSRSKLYVSERILENVIKLSKTRVIFITLFFGLVFTLIIFCKIK
ncbi:hypothetical protein NBO_48g0011 [Nosema bombycis CQ1]|uniref:Uncharacterized protein n=1 Tax=Nosema bombycis (strain CQ1 / CVCC 102059) TaxID=578461 RepID=R0KT48_NOSB1|nr:hypothetical protein NBO_48g0011 [Nosema bombycis CQ1]|eukprot:EOB13961.1 hypothetical protein NBO_48g0011 [Nosema bombycis CQ1]